MLPLDRPRGWTTEDLGEGGGVGDRGREVEGLVLYVLVTLITVTWGREVTMRSAIEENYFSDYSLTERK